MSTPLHRLQDRGQSVWYDNIHRALLESGGLRDYVERYAVSGVTSNPSIFEKAISGGSDYDDALQLASERGVDDTGDLFWDLAVRDIQDAADVLRATYHAGNGTDGFVSLEVPPRLSHDSEGSVRLGIELFDRINRPNTMIKVPGTAEGVAASKQFVTFGVNVNVTLLFPRPVAGGGGCPHAGPRTPHRSGRRPRRRIGGVVLHLPDRRQGQRPPPLGASQPAWPAPSSPTPTTTDCWPASAGGACRSPAPDRSTCCGRARPRRIRRCPRPSTSARSLRRER